MARCRICDGDVDDYKKLSWDDCCDICVKESEDPSFDSDEPIVILEVEVDDCGCLIEPSERILIEPDGSFLYE